MGKDPNFDIDEAHLHFAKITNGRTWALLTQETRSKEDDLELVLVANTSLYHWTQVGTPINLQRGEWLLAHVYTVLGRGEAALQHAERCLRLTKEHTSDMKDFDFAYAYEGMARASGLVGNLADAKSFYEEAKKAGEAIVDEEDRSIFVGDFEAGDWYGVI